MRDHWLLLLFDGCTPDQGGLVLLMLWRAWIVQNYITCNLGSANLIESIHFLLSYRNIVLQVRQNDMPTDTNGKGLKGRNGCPLVFLHLTTGGRRSGLPR